MKEEPLNEVVTAKASIMHRLTKVVQEMAANSYRGARRLFCCRLDAVSWEELTCCSAQNYQRTEDKTTQVALLNPPSTILIVNISNSTLIDCVIGNNTHSSTVTESQPLMQEPANVIHDQMQCSDSCGQQEEAHPPPPPPAEPRSINITSSSLSCVIIGDNNNMHIESMCEALTIQS